MKNSKGTSEDCRLTGLPLWISRRLRAGSSSGTTGTVIAVTGVALALIVMEFTLAVVNGFKHGIIERLEGFEAQMTVEPAYDPYSGASAPFIEYNPELESAILQILPETDIRQAIHQPGILKTDNDFQGVIFMSKEGDMKFERSLVTSGEWPDFTADSTANTLCLPGTLARMLNLTVGSRIYATFIIDGAVKVRRLTVGTIFESNFADYDRSVAYVSPTLLRSVTGMPENGCTRVEIRGLNDDNIRDAQNALQNRLIDGVNSGQLPGLYPVRSIEETGAVYLNWLALLDTNVLVIFILMLAVSGFTLISSLFILILEHVSTIGLLRALGAGRTLIRNIFLNTGLRLVITGMIAGNIIAIPLLLLQQYYKILPLDPQMYYLSSVPVEINVLWFILLNAGVILVSGSILLIPSRAAVNMAPVSALNYE